MVEEQRRQILERANTVVVKVGTNVLADSAGHLDRVRMQSLSDQLVRIRGQNRRVVLVSSGAIGAGVGRLGLPGRPADLPHLQACAAVGQSVLMQAYQESLVKHGVAAAQILLTAGDFDNRTRYLNARHTINTLFEYGCLPIINENDTVSTAEIKFGDNDQLAGMVAGLLEAPLLVLLTNVPGLFTGDPRNDPSARLVPTVERIDSAVTDLAAAGKSDLGTGGMRSKLKAARSAVSSGIAVIMADGAEEAILDRIFGAESVGTLFLPNADARSARDRWLGFTVRPKGTLRLDAGAVRAIREKGKSLLPVGVSAVEGTFQRGDVVSLCDAEGIEIARGLCNYGSGDAERIRGLASDQILRVVGRLPYEEIVHRDNLAVLS